MHPGRLIPQRVNPLPGAVVAALVLASVVITLGAEPAKPPHPLVWDAMEKVIDAKPGEEAAEFEFQVTNNSTERVQIAELRPTCGCTIAQMPSRPWVLAPGETGSFRATVDFRGKHGRFAKGVYSISPAGTQLLNLVVNIPDADPEARKRNQQLAAADRQAVFSGDCASCHAAPAAGKMGGELFQAVCTICHASERRAEMVPDLAVAREPRDEAYWRKWIAEGKERTLMPAFAREHGGPLDAEQIRSLAEFLVKAFPADRATSKP